jgi:Flp pilus assembly protein TadG
MLKIRQRERGQSLVLVVLMLIVLLIFAGLALDGGMVFLDRRRMQNAADAGSLAGARELAEAMCDETDRITADATIYQAMVDYAQLNGVQSPGDIEGVYIGYSDEGVVEALVAPDGTPYLVGNSASGGIGVPDGAAGIAATTDIEHGTRLLVLTGQETSRASAYAEAMTGPPLTGGGLRPFGVPVQLMQTIQEGTSFTIDFKDKDGGAIKWASQDEQHDEQHHGWMNFAYMWNVGEDPDFDRAIDQGIGASELKEWMENGWNGQVYGGDFIHAKPGTNASGICEAPENEVFYVPIYDAIPDCPTQVYDPKPTCPHQGSSYVFHIVGFAGLKITNCEKSPEFEITAELVKTIVGQGVPAPSDGYGSNVCDLSNAMVVALVE